MTMNHTHHYVKVKERRDNPIYTVLLIVVSSFVVGSLPIIYGFSLNANSSNQDAATTSHTPWSVLAEKE